MARIELYTGEFMVSPAPLQLSLNWCSHACSYCFANLNKPDRKADVKELLGQLRNFGQHREETLVSALMRERYPVLISNLVDPFATSNYVISEAVIGQLFDMGIPVALQTRGAVSKPAKAALDAVISYLPPSVWYISIPTLDEDVRKRLEPAAPTIEHRLELIQRLRAKGHEVIIGANPFDWVGDPHQYLRTIMSLGPRHFWTGLVHFSHEQLRNMPPRSRAAIGEDLIGEATKRVFSKERHESQVDFHDIALEVDADPFSTDLLMATDFFDIFANVYEKVFPTSSQFMWEYGDDLEDDDVYEITMEHFLEYALPLLPDGTFHMPGYLFNRDRGYYDKNPGHPKKMPYETLMRTWFNDPTFSGFNLFKEGSLMVEGYRGTGKLEPVPVRDENGNLIYLFSWAGFDSPHTVL